MTAAPPPRRRWRRLLAWTVAAFLLLLAIPPAFIAIGFTLDVGFLREPVAKAIGRALHREVVFDGPASITFSLQPALRVGGIRILNPDGFAEPDLASFGDARFALDLLPLLRYNLRIRDFSARDVRVRLEVLPDGRVNWNFGAARPAVDTPKDGAASTPTPGPSNEPGLARAEVTGVSIEHAVFERIEVAFVPAGGPAHYFSLDSADVTAAEGQPLKVKLNGQVERSFPYTVDIEAGALSALLAAREPWPLKLGLDFLGTELRLDGKLFRPPQGGYVDLSIALRTDDLSQLERLLQVSLPPVGATTLSTHLRWQPGHLQLSDLEGQMGATTLRGQLALATDGPVPRLNGALTVPVLDLRPFLGKTSAVEQAPTSLLDTYRELASQTFDLRRLGDLDADLRLEVGQWLSLPGDVQDAALAVQLERGQLRSAVRVQVAGVPMQGQLEIDGRAATPTFALALSTRKSHLGGLVRLLAGLDGIEGQAERFDFGLAARGATVGALTQSVAVTVALEGGRLSYGNVAGGRPVEFRLDRFDVALPAGAALTGSARGALLGEPFSVRFSAGDLPTLAAGKRWPVALSGRASGARLEAGGQLDRLADLPIGSATDLRFSLDADHAGSVARWLGLAADAQAPVHLGGRISVRPESVRLRDFSLALGRTRMTGEFGRSAPAGAKPRMQARLDIAEVDVAQLQTLLPPKPPLPTERAGGDWRASLDLPILPQGINLGDTDFALQLRRLRLPTAEVTDLRFEGRVRNGRMPAAPFSATVAGVPFNGSASVDLRSTVPEVALQLAAAHVDVGDLLHRLRVADGVDARVDALDLSLVLRGSKPGEMLERSEMSAALQGGQWTFRNPANKPIVTVAIGRGSVDVPAGEPLRMAVDGAIDDTPVAIRVTSGRLASVAQVGSRVPFAFSAEAAGARLQLDGRVRMPLSQSEGELELQLSGNRLDTLNRLTRTALPPWGPWSLSGRFAASERGYEMPSLALQVGSSRLEGQGSLDVLAERPHAVLKLRAPSIQIDDFRLGDWSPVAEASTVEPEARKDAKELAEQARGAARQSQRLLSRATLLKQDADLDIEVTQVLSGADRLGGGQLHAGLHAGRIELAPVEVRVPGGAARLEASYEPLPGDRDVELHSRLRVDRFDYAVLARRIQSDTDMQGQFSVHMDLDATAPLDQLMRDGNGKLDIAVWPVRLKAGLFDLWAVNVFVAMLPALDEDAASKVNCAVGRFDLRDGVLTQDALWVDTTRMRAKGNARVDFHDGSLAVRLQPEAKTPQFFSLATPVEVNGHLDDFKLSLPKGSIFTTVVRFFGSIVTTPFKMLTVTPPPADGADVCADAMRTADKIEH